MLRSNRFEKNLPLNKQLLNELFQINSSNETRSRISSLNVFAVNTQAGGFSSGFPFIGVSAMTNYDVLNGKRDKLCTDQVSHADAVL